MKCADVKAKIAERFTGNPSVSFYAWKDLRRTGNSWCSRDASARTTPLWRIAELRTEIQSPPCERFSSQKVGRLGETEMTTRILMRMISDGFVRCVRTHRWGVWRLSCLFVK